jgi:putative ABC transport system permease protein
MSDLQFRALPRKPRFTALAAITLALGIGAAAALLSLIYTVLLAPLPYTDQNRLMVLWENSVKHQFGLVEFSYPNLLFWQSQNTVFAQLGAFDPISVGMSLTGGAEPVHLEATSASHNFFSTLGTKPIAGRAYGPEEDRVGARHVAVMSHRLWQRLFASDPKTVGRQLKLDSDSYEVVGIMPEGFDYPRGADLWIPLVPALGKENSELRLLRAVRGIGRLKPGVTEAKAQAEVVQLAKRLEKEHPETNDGISAAVVPLMREIFGEIRPVFLKLLAGSLLLLLIAVVNVAHLVRARNREGGLTLAKALALFLASGLGGLLLAFLGIRLLRVYAPESIPRIEQLHLNLPIFLLTLATSAIAVAIFSTLRAGKETPAWGRRALVGLELALALVLLVTTGIMARDFQRLRQADLGYHKEHVLTMRIRLPGKGYPGVPERREFFERLVGQVKPIPGVVSVATISARPLDTSAVFEMPIVLEGQNWGKQITNPLTNFEAVSPSYFHTLEIPLVKGRDFNDGDTPKSPAVAIVSESMAARFWPGKEPLGMKIRQFLPENSVPWMTVVGVVGDGKYRALDQQRFDFYLPARQNPLAEYMDYQDLIVRSAGDPYILAAPIRKAVRSLDPNLSISSTLSLEGLVDRELSEPQFKLLLMAVFGFVALYLAVVGVYSLFSSPGPGRSRETGVHTARPLAAVRSE